MDFLATLGERLATDASVAMIVLLAVIVGQARAIMWIFRRLEASMAREAVLTTEVVQSTQANTNALDKLSDDIRALAGAVRAQANS